ncbi:MAG: ATP-dependent helicase [Ignavibacteria bacterium]|nr:ATP-dependent helicase [Ignavibacteria bacterium]
MDMNKLIPDSMKEGSTEKLPGKILSPMQDAILDAVEFETDNLSIEAVAGSGKTFTILLAMQRARGSVLFLAFNKSIADELREKTPFGTDCKTFNGLGHGLLKRRASSSDLDKWKLSKLLKPRMSATEYKEFGWEIIKLVGSMKSSGLMEPPMSSDFVDRIEHSEVPMNRITYGAMLLEELWTDSLDVTEFFTFDDQLFMPVFWDMTFPQYDTVFVDEAQDLNPIQHMMLSKLAERGARVIAVGDSRQAIYGFRGALTNSMEELNTKFECVEYPLSICYRCAKSIVRLAQEIVPQIEPHENAPEGTITHLEDGICPTDIPPDSIIMCRTNAPMFRYAVQFLKYKMPCMVMSNFGEQLIKFVKGFDVTRTEDLADEIEIWRKEEIAEAESRELFHKINRINDKARSILPFCDEYRIKSQVIQALERLLRSDSGPRLCTIHKAKGLEAEYAYLLRPDLVPGPWIEEDTEEYQQEENLRYVAITRAKENLVFMMEYEDEVN